MTIKLTKPTEESSASETISRSSANDTVSNLDDSTVWKGSVEVLKGHTHFDTLRSEWNCLWTSCVEATDAQAWHWQRNYWTYVASKRVPIFSVARDQQGIAGIGVFASRRDRKSLITQIEFLTEHDADYNVLIHRPGLPVSVGKQMFGAVLRPSSRLAEFCCVPESSWTARALRQCAEEAAISKRIVDIHPSETYCIELPSTMEAYWNGLEQKARKRLQYDVRRLNKDCQIDFQVPQTEAEFEEALRNVEDLHRTRWGDGSSFNDVRHAAFFRETARESFRLGICRMFLLKVNGELAGAVVGAVLRDRICIPYVIHNPTIPNKYSAGLMVNIFAIEHSIKCGIKRYDLTRGSEHYKGLLGGEPSRNLKLQIFSSSIQKLAHRAISNHLGPKLRRNIWFKKISDIRKVRLKGYLE